MNDMERIKLYEKAMQYWGISSQLNMVVEECSELIKAVQKAKRAKTDKQRAICEMLIAYEVADVEIMCEQVRQMFKDQPFDKLKDLKLERLKKRLGV